MNYKHLALELVEHIMEVYGLDEVIAVLQDLGYGKDDIYDLFMNDLSIELVDFNEEQA